MSARIDFVVSSVSPKGDETVFKKTYTLDVVPRVGETVGFGDDDGVALQVESVHHEADLNTVEVTFVEPAGNDEERRSLEEDLTKLGFAIVPDEEEP